MILFYLVDWYESMDLPETVNIHKPKAMEAINMGAAEFLPLAKEEESEEEEVLRVLYFA